VDREPEDRTQARHDASVARAASEPYCYLRTVGRRTGRPHEIEIWFVLRGQTMYLLSGGGDRSDWVRNLLADPHVVVRIGDERFTGTARIVDAPDEDGLARDLLVEKYAPGYEGDLSEWRGTAVPVAIDLGS
jgi:deazaflavin-dependent oxidoreductase (nitroreductase family)